jgi:hypothetical protein
MVLLFKCISTSTCKHAVVHLQRREARSAKREARSAKREARSAKREASSITRCMASLKIKLHFFYFPNRDTRLLKFVRTNELTNEHNKCALGRWGSRRGRGGSLPSLKCLLLLLLLLSCIFLAQVCQKSSAKIGTCDLFFSLGICVTKGKLGIRLLDTSDLPTTCFSCM